MNLSSVLILALGEAHLELEFPLQFLGFQLKSWMVWCCVVLVTLLVEHYFMTRRRKVYLLDFACYKPKPSCKGTKEVFMDRIISTGSFTQESIDFQRKVVEKSGLGPDDTFIAEAFLHNPPRLCMEEARKEAETVILGAIDEVLEKTGVKATDIGILVVNCSLFNPVPSLSSMVVNHYKLREDILSFHLGGMGCSASPISIDLAKNLLQVHKDSYALVVSMESMTLNWYLGNDKSMLVSNCLFRMGGAAILLSNKRSDLRRSKYELLHTVRTHKGSDDISYGSVTQREDSVGKVGISLSKDLMDVAGDALRSNIISLGPLVLPISEQIKYFVTIVARKVFHAKMKPYVPDFKLAFEHFCVHAGGRAVLDEVEKSLNLTKWHMEPSRMTLFKFGNVSSSSPWYELAYIEAKGRVKRGDKTWQIAFGSGFKCNSIVWRALKTIDPAKEKSPWISELDKF